MNWVRVMSSDSTNLVILSEAKDLCNPIRPDYTFAFLCMSTVLQVLSPA